jgi:hypothetical protein
LGWPQTVILPISVCLVARITEWATNAWLELFFDYWLPVLLSPPVVCLKL